VKDPGQVTADGIPIISLELAGRVWTAIVDSGVNGDVGLPSALREFVNPCCLCRIRSPLAGGQTIEADG
jgi:hypothetical protein